MDILDGLRWLDFALQRSMLQSFKPGNRKKLQTRLYALHRCKRFGFDREGGGNATTDQGVYRLHDRRKALRRFD